MQAKLFCQYLFVKFVNIDVYTTTTTITTIVEFESYWQYCCHHNVLMITIGNNRLMSMSIQASKIKSYDFVSSHKSIHSEVAIVGVIWEGVDIG